MVSIILVKVEFSFSISLLKDMQWLCQEQLDIVLSFHLRFTTSNYHFDIYLCNRCLSPLMLRIPISIRARCTQLCDKFVSATGRWFSPCPLVSSTNKTDRHDIAEILLKVALNTIKQTNKQTINYATNYSKHYILNDFLL